MRSKLGKVQREWVHCSAVPGGSIARPWLSAGLDQSERSSGSLHQSASNSSTLNPPIGRRCINHTCRYYVHVTIDWWRSINGRNGFDKLGMKIRRWVIFVGCLWRRQLRGKNSRQILLTFLFQVQSLLSYLKLKPDI